MPRLDLYDRPIAITGASSGIGAATARACARAGMPVALMARRNDKLEAVAQSIRNAGGRAIVVTGDVNDPEHGTRLIAATTEAFGPVHAVFANAGYGSEGAIIDTPDEDIRQIFETNFWGTLATIRPAINAMRNQRSGHLLICSSCLSKIGIPYVGPYCATKAAQDHLGRALRHELRNDGINVTTVHPIGTRTEFFDIAADKSRGETTFMRTPNAFMQPPERVANAIVRCLRKPRGEVWTSPTVRTVLALSTALPGLTDRLIAGRLGKERR